jgi:hypothetical protein
VTMQGSSFALDHFPSCSGDAVVPPVPSGTLGHLSEDQETWRDTVLERLSS